VQLHTTQLQKNTRLAGRQTLRMRAGAMSLQITQDALWIALQSSFCVCINTINCYELQLHHTLGTAAFDMTHVLLSGITSSPAPTESANQPCTFAGSEQAGAETA
jgi:hypothetical protein